jgi:hypothetical protein
VDAKAKVINISVGLSTWSLVSYKEVEAAYDYAMEHGVIIVAASGNQGNIGYRSLLNHHWVIPVAACDEHGSLDPTSNFGPSIGSHGLMAPGVNITSCRAHNLTLITSHTFQVVLLLMDIWTMFVEFVVSHSAAISAISAVIALVTGLIFNAVETRKQSRVARGNFWLELEKMFQHYDSFYRHLRFKRGDWICSESIGPCTEDDIAQLCDYLGLFEHCNNLLKNRIIDLETFSSIYKTRVIGLLSNGMIRQELQDRKK